MRRRVLITIAASAALLLVAAVAIAAWLSLKETEPSNFTAAAATIRVDIGNAETDPLFNLTAMEPGDNAEACFRAAIDVPGSIPTVAKLYSGGVFGTGLAEYLTVNIAREDPVAAGTEPGIILCSEVTGTLTQLTGGPTPLDIYDTLAGSYGTGASLGTLFGKTVNTVDIKIVMTLPATAPSAAGGLTASAIWTVEDQ
jgi:hypothetical protein